jgi:hypothetical protein
MDYGTVTCAAVTVSGDGEGGWDVGVGKPCVFHIVPTGEDYFRHHDIYAVSEHGNM